MDSKIVKILESLQTFETFWAAKPLKMFYKTTPKLQEAMRGSYFCWQDPL